MRKKITLALIAKLQSAGDAVTVRDTEVTGLEVRIGPQRSTFYVRGTIDYERFRVKLGSAEVLTPDVARKMAREKLVKAAQGENPRRQKAPAILPLGEFLETVYAPGAATHLRTADALVMDLKSTFAHLLSMRLDRITPAHIERWKHDMLTKPGRNGKLRKPAAVNRRLSKLQAMFRRAKDWGHLPQDHENPIEKVERPKETQGRTRFLSDAELRRLDKALRKRLEEKKKGRESHRRWLAERGHADPGPLVIDAATLAIRMALGTGLRRQELFSLRWSDIDLQAEYLTVRGETNKVGRGRNVPLIHPLPQELKAWKKQQGKSEYVFPDGKGGHLHDVNTAFKRIIEDAKVERLTWHDMRHSFASKLVASGCDLYTLSKLLGHSSVSMTHRYAHLGEQHLTDGIRRLERPGSNIIEVDFLGKDKQTSSG